MKRRTFVAELNRGGKTLAMAEAHAWNSAIRASESLVRNHAQKAGEAFLGEDPLVWGRPAAPGAEYRRSWVGESSGERLSVRMTEVFS